VRIVTFGGLSSLRVRVQFLAPQPPALGPVLTLVMDLASGLVTGLLLPRASLRAAGVLALLTVGVLGRELPRRAGGLAPADPAVALGALAVLGVVACGAGCAAAGILRAQRARVSP
jgi:hypothetical protein